MRNANRNVTYYGWKEKCDRLGYTFEMTVIMTRVVFTSEPENLKAVLTTQFNDFGKPSTVVFVRETMADVEL